MSKESHAEQPVYVAGVELAQAQAAMVMVHGRGATAESILALSASELHRPGYVYLAPQAIHNSWYPYSFLNPLEDNEPHLTSALEKLSDLLAYLADAGLLPEQTLLLGFSQGACLALEFVARNARRYGGVAGLSGGLIGPAGTLRDYAGSLDGTPLFLGCSDVDPHIPKERVEESADVLRRLGADVTMRIYPGLGHTINQDEIAFVQQMMAALSGAPDG
jgi:phospholipase/carboxylesterase